MRKYLGKAVIIAFFVGIMFLFNIFTDGRFLRSNNVINILSHITVPVLMACSLCFIVTAGRIDLSLGSILVLSSNIAAVLALQLGYIGLFIGGLGSAVAFITLNTLIEQRLKVPAWIAGLGMAMVYEGIAVIYLSSMVARGSTVAALENVCRELGRFPTIIIVCAVAILFAYIMFNYTSSGINIRAIGGNFRVSDMMGINLNKTGIISGILGGVFMGFAAMVNISSANRIIPTSGLTTLATIFQPLAIYFLANALSKWLNLITGLVFSSIFVMSLFNFLTRKGIPSGTWQNIVLGLSIILFGILAMRGHKGVVK